MEIIFSPMFTDLGMKQGFSFTQVTRNACIPLLGVERLDVTKEEKQACAELTKNTLDYLNEHPNIKTVVLASRWSLHAEGTLWGNEEGKEPVYRIVGDTSESGHNHRAFSKGMEKLLLQLGQMKRKVVLLGQVPEFGFYSGKCIAKGHLYQGEAFEPKLCQISRKLVEERQAFVQGELARWGQEMSHVRFIPLIAELCQTEACFAQEDNVVLYKDDDHLSVVALLSRSRYLLLALIPLLLSSGVGMDLPLLEYIRFPYRWHIATLVLIGFALAQTLEKYRWWWLAPIIMLEGLFLSPVESVLPTASTQIPAIYANLQQPVLDIPGPLSFPAGTPNRSRERSKYLLFAQLTHQNPSVWAHDFNLLYPKQQPHLTKWQSWDPLRKQQPLPPSKSDLEYLQKNEISIVIHKLKIGRTRAKELQRALEKHGWQPKQENDTHLLYESKQ